MDIIRASLIEVSSLDSFSLEGASGPNLDSGSSSSSLYFCPLGSGSWNLIIVILIALIRPAVFG